MTKLSSIEYFRSKCCPDSIHQLWGSFCPLYSPNLVLDPSQYFWIFELSTKRQKDQVNPRSVSKVMDKIWNILMFGKFPKFSSN